MTDRRADDTSELDVSALSSDESAAIDRDRRPRWVRRYGALLLATDFLVVFVAVFASQLLWFGREWAYVAGVLPISVSYWLFSFGLIVAWTLILGFYDSRDERVIGMGAGEYKRVFSASLTLFGVIAIAAFVFKIDPARGYIATAFPIGLLGLLGMRALWRRWLVSRRLDGRFMFDVIVVGSDKTTRYLLDKLHRYPAAGYRPIGVILAGPAAQAHPIEIHGLPIVGTVDDVARAAVDMQADQVILTSSDHLPPRTVRRIGWALEATSIKMAVAPAVTEVAGPRIHTRPIEGLPLLSVEVPRFEGGKHVTKVAFDWTAAALAILVCVPVGLVIAALIAIESRGQGGIFFLQNRVGRNGHVFKMFKFRTMVPNAEALKVELLAKSDRPDLLFKMKDDPRVTKVGRVLRRFSLDELPQLINVVRGEMAMVGPRPPLVDEVAKYETDVRRRLLVKPGITGPWQVSGRSDLSWQEGVRLDLYYVENWSLAGDVVLLLRTAGAVLRGRGAY